MTPPPEALTVGPLTLRRHRSSDATPITEAVLESGADLSRYETWAHTLFGEADGRRYAENWYRAWQDGTAHYFAVEQDDRYLGACGLSAINHDHSMAGLGFWVRSSATGRGVATSAARAVIEFGFDHLGLYRIELMAAVDNAASLRVAEKLGAAREGVLRKRLTLGGVPTDCVLLAVVR